MDKDEILKKSRKEFEGRHEYLEPLNNKAAYIGLLAGAFMAVLIGRLHYAYTGEITGVGFLVTFTITSVMLLYRYYLGRYKTDLYLGIVFTAIDVWTFVCYIQELMRLQ